MKMRSALLVFVCIAAASCRVDDEPAGIAYYYIRNLTDQSFIVYYQLTNNLGSEEGSKTITSNKSTEIFFDAIIGVNPKPSDTFQWLIIRDTNNDVYTEQDPVDNDVWAQELFFDSGYGRTNYYWIIE